MSVHLKPFGGLSDAAPTMPWIHNPAVSKAQAGLFGAIAGGAKTKVKGMSVAQAKESLRGQKLKKLPERVPKKGK